MIFAILRSESLDRTYAHDLIRIQKTANIIYNKHTGLRPLYAISLPTTAGCC